MEENVNGKIHKCITVCYKAIGINTYNVFVIDLETKLIRYWFEMN